MANLVPRCLVQASGTESNPTSGDWDPVKAKKKYPHLGDDWWEIEGDPAKVRQYVSDLKKKLTKLQEENAKKVKDTLNKKMTENAANFDLGLGLGPRKMPSLNKNTGISPALPRKTGL